MKRKAKQYITVKIHSLLSNNVKIAVLSLSFILLSIFLIIISLMTPYETIKEQRLNMGAFSFFIGYYLIPFCNMKTKDKIMSELGKLVINLLVGIVTLYYWISTIDYPEVPFLIDVIMSIPFIFLFYYFLYKVYLITQLFIKFIQSFTLKIFPNSKPSGLKYLFEHLTAILISVSGALGTLLAIAKIISELIGLFK